jgi:hypothetical protein
LKPFRISALTKRVLGRTAVAATAGAVLVLGLIPPTAASADTGCVRATVSTGWVTNTLTIENNCSGTVRVRALMSAPIPGGYPCVTIPSGMYWKLKYVKAYHVFWGTQFC